MSKNCRRLPATPGEAVGSDATVGAAGIDLLSLHCAQRVTNTHLVTLPQPANIFLAGSDSGAYSPTDRDRITRPGRSHC